VKENRPPHNGWLFLFLGIQYLSSALLLLPASQPYRMFIRALPYAASLGLLLIYLIRHRRGEALAPWSRLLFFAMLLLFVSLLHPSTNLPAGVGQLIFQLSIVAPAFWAAYWVHDKRTLSALIWIVFFASALSSIVGVLQVYYPAVFMPREFSSLALQLNPYAITSLTYIGADGRELVRPPGLTDYPGGAAVAGMTTALLGLLLSITLGASTTRRLACLGLGSVGLVVLYLTQIRSLLMMLLISLVVVALLLLRQGRFAASVNLGVTTAFLVSAAFVWAIRVGGESVYERFRGLIDVGPVASYQLSRGGFLEYTFRELLFSFPFGAGVGRWGMMQVYFDRGDPSHSPPIHAEIQLTGWLLDGGILMWVLYGGAVLSAMIFAYKALVGFRDPTTRGLTLIVFATNLVIAGQTLAGPTFNTQMGIQFWLMVTALHRVTRAKTSRAKVFARPRLVVRRPAAQLPHHAPGLIDP